MHELLRKSLEIYPTSSLPHTEVTPSFFSAPPNPDASHRGALVLSSYLGGSLSELRQDRKGLKLSSSSGAVFRK